MKTTTRLLPILLLSSLATVAVAAEEFDGSKPLMCRPQSGHDCLPGENTCKPLKAEPGKDPHVRIDIAKMSVKSPYRTAELPIQAFNNNSKALTLQGTTLDLVWSAAIFRQTGKITIAIADREGAYVIFGQCKIDSAPPQSRAQ
jgi:hypothetical protein